MPSTGSGYTDRIDPLVRHAAEFPGDGIPKPVLEHASRLLLDTLGCIIAGSSAEGITELRDTLLVWGGNPLAHTLCYGDLTSPTGAAFLNSVMGHARDYDDTHDEALNHGCVTLVPALMATCEALAADDASSRSISGLDFVAALALGLDISNRLGLAFIPYLHVGWLPTTLWGPIACAAACGRLLGLDIEAMHHAFGIAYSQIHGNRQALADGALAKRMQPGFSASAGVQAAFFAHRGLTGGRRIVDGEFGIPALYTQGRIDANRLSQGLGETFETSRVSIKPYPSCRCTHPVIDAALELREQYGITPGDVAGGTIRLPPPSMGQIGSPFRVRENPTVDAQFSAQYTAALSLTEGRPAIRHFHPDFVTSRRDLHELGAGFEVVEFEKHRATLVPIELELKLRSGLSHKTRVEQPKGGPDNPLSLEELLAKFEDCLDNSTKEYSRETRARIVDNALGATDLSDIGELLSCLYR